LEAFEETSDTFKEVDEGVITFTDARSCLIGRDMGRIELTKDNKEIHTARRTSIPTKTALAGESGVWMQWRR
jgi:hypothetical protein